MTHRHQWGKMRRGDAPRRLALHVHGRVDGLRSVKQVWTQVWGMMKYKQGHP